MPEIAPNSIPTSIATAPLAEDIVTNAEVATATESMVRRAILDGTDPQEAYLKYGKF